MALSKTGVCESAAIYDLYYIKVEKPDTTFLCTFHGTVHQQSVDKSTDKDVTSYHHKAYRYIKTVSGVEDRKGGLDYHDDHAMVVLGEKIDVKIPWGKSV